MASFKTPTLEQPDPRRPWSEAQPEPTSPTPKFPSPEADPTDTTTLPNDAIGDIPPPPIPKAPQISAGMNMGMGMAGGSGTGGSTFARPGTRAAMPFRTPAFGAGRSSRFGPGAPLAGGSSFGVGGDEGGGLGLSADDAAELLRTLVAGRGQV